MVFSGWLDLPWWGYVIAALVLTHITIASVTIYLHRHQAHRALDLHPVVSHFFRFWLWLTTGMVTKEWAAIHRKHHAKCETAEDPHSPQVHGINKRALAGRVPVREGVAQQGDDGALRPRHARRLDRAQRLYAELGVGPVADGRDQHRAVRPGSRHADPAGADRLDPVLGRRRHQRHRPLLGLSQLRRRRTPAPTSCRGAS